MLFCVLWLAIGATAQVSKGIDLTKATLVGVSVEHLHREKIVGGRADINVENDPWNARLLTRNLDVIVVRT